MTQDDHHTTAEEWERAKAEQARQDAGRRKNRGTGTRPRSLRRDLWDWICGWGLGILGIVVILFGAATISNTLDGKGLVSSDAGSFAISGAAIAVGLWCAVAAFRRWSRSGF